MTLRTALQQGAQILEDGGIAAPRLTAEVLLMHAVGCQRSWLYAHATDDLKELWWIHYGRYLHQRLEGKPTQYITGRQEFYGREFRVSPDVLIPRPETEHLVEAALRLGPQSKVVDIGTGSGAIAATLALEWKALVFATDISTAALRVARNNAQRLDAWVEFARMDLAEALPDARFDLVASNPPYVPLTVREGLQREVREYEPHVALFGGDDGLDAYRRLIPGAARILKPGGWLLMEVGLETSDRVKELLTGWNAVEIRPDLAGFPRVAIAQRPA